MKNPIFIEALINASIEKVWESWTESAHIVKWNHASDDWHCPKAENDLRIGGKFCYRMESTDGKIGFDFVGTYRRINPQVLIEYILDDGRKVDVQFKSIDGITKVVEIFEAENENPHDMQKTGWQAILNNFKKFTESE